MKHNLKNLITNAAGVVAPLALALAVMTANATCYFFTYQPEVPKSLEKHCVGHRPKL